VDLLSFVIQKEKTTTEKIWLNEKMYVIDLDTEKQGIALHAKMKCRRYFCQLTKT